MVGTAAQRTVPFGAFCGQLAGAHIADDGRPAELLRAAHDYLTGDGARQLFVVDDAHLLDHLSATLVYQLALSGSARLIVTVRADTELPDAVDALWADELLTRVDVEPLDRAATATVLESALDTAPDERRDRRRVRRSRGNPLHLRHLVGTGDLRARASLDELVDGYLSGLPSPVRSVLDYLALAEPLRRSDLAALAGQDAVDHAEALGAIVVDGDAMVYPAHPLYTARARAGADARRRAQAAHVAGRPLDVAAIRPPRRPAAARRAQRRQRLPRRGRRHRGRGPAGAAARRADTRRATRQGRAGPRGRTARAAGAGLCAGLAGPRTGGRRGVGGGGSRAAVAARADRVGAAAGGQPVLDAQRAGAGHRVPADHPRPRRGAERAGHPRRAGGDVRDERGRSAAHAADRRRGAGVAARRRRWPWAGRPRRRR